MTLLRDLWAASPRRTLALVLLVALGAAGQTGASALAGQVLLHRSVPFFLVLVVALVLAVISDVAIGLLMARITADWGARTRRALCRVALGQDLPALDATPVGEMLDRIDNDVYQVGSELRNNGIRLVQSLAFAALSVLTALVIWWPAGVGMVVVLVVLTLTLRRRTLEIGPVRIAEEEAWSDLAAVTEESIHGQDDVRTSLARPYVLRLYASRAAEVLARGRRVWIMSAWVTGIAVTVMRLGIASVVVIGAWALSRGAVDAAGLTAIWLLVLGFGGVVEQLGRVIPEMQNAFGAWARVRLLRESTQEPTGGETPFDADLHVRGLTFEYEVEEGRGPALRDVTLEFRRGRSYAVIGRTGSGKSTLAKVLTRSVDLPRGTVFLGATDVLDLDLEALRRFVAIVPQRTDILAGTLAENVALFDPERLGAAAAAMTELGLTDWVDSLPDGMATRLGDGGYVLSAGQAQLVAFARILVRDPHVVILDEATARLDPVTEARVQRATQRLLRERIGIVIAHRLSSVRSCDEVVVLADGRVVETGPLTDSAHFAELLRASDLDDGGPAPAGPPSVPGPRTASSRTASSRTASPRTAASSAPTLPAVPPARTLRELVQLTLNDARFGVVAVAIFGVVVFLGLDGSLLAWLWADVVDGSPSPWWPVAGIVAALIFTAPGYMVSGRLFPEWWVNQMLRIGARLVHGQTGPRRISKHTPAEVVAQAGDTERVIILADNLFDQLLAVTVIISMTAISGSVLPALFFGATMVVSGLVAAAFGTMLESFGRKTVAARAAFATGLVSALTAARTVKLSGATRPVLDHLDRLERARSDRQRREIALQVIARSAPAVTSGLLPIGAWAVFLGGGMSAGATLVAVATLGSARWFAWTTSSFVSGLPSARVWTRRTVEMAGVANYSAAVPGVDLSAGTGPTPAPPPRHALRRLDLSAFSAVHEDGTVGAAGVDLTVHKGQLVLLLGPVGSGKSSLLRAMAGIVHHTGTLRWNGEAVREPEVFLRPNQVGYVGQLPRVLTGTVAENIRLGREVDVAEALTVAQLDHDLATVGSGGGGGGGGHTLLVGHKGIRLSGGQLQRLALARALAPDTELLIADDISSALDVTTELALWQALRERGVTVVGSTSKRAALTHADLVMVLVGGRAVDQGPWQDLSQRWGHLAG